MAKRVTILFGNGAAIDWNAPKTNTITNKLIKDNNFQTTKDGTNIFKNISNKLLNNGFKEDNLNFESLIGALEDLYIYHNLIYLNKNIEPSYNFPSLLKDKFWIKNLKNYEVKDGFFKSKIHGNEPVEKIYSGNPALQDLHFFTGVFHEAIKLVNCEIIPYCNEVNNERFYNQNQRLKYFVSFLEEHGYIVRCYTTNYDRLLPDIFGNDRKVYDGFDENNISNIKGGEMHRYNIQRIQNEKNNLNYYNLHGCVFWDLDSNLEGKDADFDYHFYRTPGVNPSIIGWEKNLEGSQPIYMFNIVTGLNKLQRISLQPLSEFYSVFQEDCIKSNLIITVGYSFGDPHLNYNIKTGVSFDDTNLLHITKQEPKNLLNYTNEGKKINECLKKDDRFDPNDLNKGWLTSKKGTHKIYTNSFIGFLNENFEKIDIF